MVHVRVRVSFNGLVRGETADMPDSPELRMFERAGWLEVSGGTGEDRPGGPEKGDPGRVDERASGGGAARAEPLEDPVSGGHRPVEGVDQGAVEPDLDASSAVHDFD